MCRCKHFIIYTIYRYTLIFVAFVGQYCTRPISNHRRHNTTLQQPAVDTIILMCYTKDKEINHSK